MINKRFDLVSKYNELKRPLLLDGAMGTYLLEKKLQPDKYLWQSIHNIHNRKIVKSVYEEYIDAGADILTTNTFRTNPSAVKKSNLGTTNYDFVKQSVEIVHEVRRNLNLIIAGSNAPAEDCYQKERNLSNLDLEYNHKKHIEMLWSSGVDFILNETFSHWDEIEITCKYCNENRIPFVMSLFFNEDLKLLSGEPLNEAVNFVSDFSPIAIGFNCIKVDTFKKYVDQFSIRTRFGFYFNCGLGDINDEQITCGIDPNSYVKSIRSLINYNTLFIGSCCGSSPSHTSKIKEFLDEVY